MRVRHISYTSLRQIRIKNGSMNDSLPSQNTPSSSAAVYRYGESKIYIFVITFDKVLPAHPQVTLVEVDNPLCRVLDVSRDREIEEVVCAVSLRSEAIIQLLPEMNDVCQPLRASGGPLRSYTDQSNPSSSQASPSTTGQPPNSVRRFRSGFSPMSSRRSVSMQDWYCALAMTKTEESPSVMLASRMSRSCCSRSSSMMAN